jgi:hypothetical protein
MYLPSEKLPNVQATSHLARAGRPERARDALGTVALAIVMTSAWQHLRPHGLKLYAETVFAEDGLVEDHFAELAAAGIRRLKFQRPISHVADAERYCRWAHDRGMLVLAHTGNRSLIKDVDDIGESLRVIRPTSPATSTAARRRPHGMRSSGSSPTPPPRSRSPSSAISHWPDGCCSARENAASWTA